MLSSRRLLGLVLSVTLATGVLAAAPPALASTTSPDSVTVDYNGQGQYQISTTTLTGPVGATFAFRNRINGQSLYLQNGTGSVTLGQTNCTGNQTCGVAAGADGTFTVTSAGTISVNTSVTDGRFTLTIVDGAGGSSAEPARATLTYDANGGTCSTTSSGAQSLGSWVTVPDVGTCSRTGWTLLGFSTSRTNAPGSVFLTPGASTAITGDNTLFAQWTVRVAADWTSSACPGADVVDIQPGEAVTLPSAKVCGSEILAGWGLSPAVATPVTYAPGQVVRPTSNLTVWAVWSPVLRVSLTCAVASGSPVDVVDVGRDLPLTLPLACHDTQVARWTTNADGTGTSYPAGSTMRTTSDQTLYARAEGAPVTVTWHGNGGTCPRATTSVAWGSTFAPAACRRPGYVITGWTTNGSATGTSLVGMPLRTSVDAYPLWAVAPVLGANWVYKCSPTFTAATWNPVTGQFEVTLPAGTACDNAPYSLLSWTTELDGTGTRYEPGETIPLTSSLFVAAQWGVPVTYDYNLPEGDTSCPTITVLEPFGRTSTVPAASTCERGQSLLANWATTRTWTMGVNPNLVRPGGTLTALAPVTYYAWWGPPVEITFDGAGGTCTPTSVTVGLGGLFPLPDVDDCTRTDYRLTGWALTADAAKPFLAPGGTGMAFFFGQPRLVAQWVSTSHCAAPAAAGVDWHDCDKSYANLTGATLTGANLAGALFDFAQLGGANLTGATVTDASFAGAVLDRADLSSLDLTGGDLLGANLANANLTNANLTGANLIFATLTGAALSGATLDDANLSFANASKASLSRAKMTGTTLFMTNLEGVNASRATMPEQDLTTARLTGASFADANLADTDLTKAKIGSVSFAGATLDRADLTGVTGSSTVFTNAHGTAVTLVDANLPGTNMTSVNFPSVSAAGINLKGAKVRSAILTGADFARATLTKADFTDSDLTDAALTSTNLSEVDFARANLGRVTLTSTTIGTANFSTASVQNVNLTGKDLSTANLPYTNFGGSNLTSANLSNRDLTGVFFSNATLSNANFQGAYTAQIGKGCQAENYYRSAGVIVAQPMRNLPVVPWLWLETLYNKRGRVTGTQVRYENAQWGMDDSGHFLMFCARPT